MEKNMKIAITAIIVIALVAAGAIFALGMGGNGNGGGTDTHTTTVDVDAPISASKIAEIKDAAAKDSSYKLVIKNDNYAFSFNSAAISALSSEESKLDVKPVDASTLDPKVFGTIGDNASVISIDFGNNKDFGKGEATVTVPYTLPSGCSASDVVVYYIDGDNNVVKMPGTYAAGKVTFTTTHFSMFAVGVKEDTTPYDTDGRTESEVRLRIYGNANGDDVLDRGDVLTLEKIMSEGIENWQEKYFFADANLDGVIDAKDVEIVDKFLRNESCRMYYETAFATKDRFDGTNTHETAYVNFPIGHKIGCEYSDVDILGVLGIYDYFSATSTSAQNDYGESTYPGISSLPVMGKKDGLEAESIAAAGVDTVVMWTGGTSTNYFWKTAVDSGLADTVSFVMVPVQGENCINGVLMLAAMLGDQTLSEKYAKWYDGAMELLEKIDSVEKKTILVCQVFPATTAATLQAYKQYQSPALWFSKVVNFTDATAGQKGFLKFGDIEGFVAAATDEVIVMTKHPADVDDAGYADWISGKLASLFEGADVPQYKDGKIYTIDFSIMPFFGGPAACYVLAAYLYPELFSMDDALDYMQEYIDQFLPVHRDVSGMTYPASVEA